MEWLIAIGLTLYVIYRFWKIVLKWMLIVTVFLFIFLVLKFKTSFSGFTGFTDDVETEEVIKCFDK